MSEATEITERTEAKAVAAVEAEAPKPESTGDPLLDMLLNSIAPLEATSKYMKLLVFGEPGCGKTTLGGGAPKLLIVDAEKGAVPLAGTAASENVMKMKSIKQLELLIQYLKAGYKQFDKYESILLDTLSEIHKRGLSEIAEREFKDPAQFNRSNRFLNEGADHQENNERIRRIISDLRDLDRHIIVTCHVKRLMNKDQGVDKLMPDFSEKLVNTCNAVFDVVGYMSYEVQMDGTDLRKLVVKSSGSHAVKTRINTFPPAITNPTWPKLYAKYQEFLTANNGQ